MTSNVRDLEAVRNAESAKRLLDDPEIKKAFDKVQDEYLQALLTASEKDDLGRFRYAEAIKVVKMVKQHLHVVVGNGSLSKRYLDEMSGKKKRFF